MSAPDPDTMIEHDSSYNIMRLIAVELLCFSLDMFARMNIMRLIALRSSLGMFARVNKLANFANCFEIKSMLNQVNYVNILHCEQWLYD